MTPLWHYSKAAHLTEIFESGFLKLATAGVPVTERPALWLSSNQKIEWTAYPEEPLSELENSGYRPIRFLLNPQMIESGKVKLVTWKKHKQKGRMIKQHAKSLEDAARTMGANCADWWCSYEPIAVECFLSVDIIENGEWKLFSRREPDAD